jgi:putative glycosyltransferase (TIGR04372 family)
MKILINFNKNFFFKIKLVISFILLIPIYLIMFCLRPFLIIRFAEIDLSRIGHSLNYELLSLYKNKKKKEIYIWFMSKKICNWHLYKMFKRNLFFFENLNIIFDTTQFFSDRYFYFLKKLIYEVDLYDYKNNLEKKKIKISLTNKEIIYGNQLLKKIGIHKNTKIVCLNVRDPAYLKKNFKNKNFSYQNYRDANIKNFVLPIKNLLKKGYFVIRMGKNVSNRTNIKHKNFLDYPFCKFQSDFMDLFLIYKCNFFIGSNTGLDCIAQLFRKPLISVNMLPISLFYLYKKKILIAPKILIKNKKKLKLSEIFNEEVHNCHTSESYKKRNITCKELNSKEINKIISEFINLEKNSWKLSKKDQKLQNKFRKKYLKLIKDNKNINNNQTLNSKNTIGYLSCAYIRANNWL